MKNTGIILLLLLSVLGLSAQDDYIVNHGLFEEAQALTGQVALEDLERYSMRDVEGQNKCGQSVIAVRVFDMPKVLGASRILGHGMPLGWAYIDASKEPCINDRPTCVKLNGALVMVVFKSEESCN